MHTNTREFYKRRRKASRGTISWCKGQKLIKSVILDVEKKSINKLILTERIH
jgi:hypothetical protein